MGYSDGCGGCGTTPELFVNGWVANGSKESSKGMAKGKGSAWPKNDGIVSLIYPTYFVTELFWSSP